MSSVSRVAIFGGDRVPFVRRGTTYAQLSNQDLLTETLRNVACKANLKGERLGEIVGGAVLKHSKDFNLTRESLLGAGFAPTTTAFDLQQACATSLQATVGIANKIALGQISSGIAAGVDSASDVPMAISNGYRHLLLRLHRAKTLGQRLSALASFRPAMLKPQVADVGEPHTGKSMGEHCEQMVQAWGITRQDQDALALNSHLHALKAYSRGFYDDLVSPFKGLLHDGILRADTTLEKLAKLPPVFDRSARGTLTAGNSTPLTDGAASVLLGNEAWGQAHGLIPWAWFVDAESAAVDFYGPDPEGLLMAPTQAISRLLERHGLSLQDFDFYEIHEAFAGQVLCTLAALNDPAYCVTRLGRAIPMGTIDRARLNVNGGSVGMGHPFAATGARIVASAAKQLADHRDRTGQRGRTLISVCAAGGLGVAAILEG